MPQIRSCPFSNSESTTLIILTIKAFQSRERKADGTKRASDCSLLLRKFHLSERSLRRQRWIISSGVSAVISHWQPVGWLPQSECHLWWIYRMSAGGRSSIYSAQPVVFWSGGIGIPGCSKSNTHSLELLQRSDNLCVCRGWLSALCVITLGIYGSCYYIPCERKERFEG